MSAVGYCRSCGTRLGPMDRVYCSAMRCQEEARAEVMSARFRAISSELGLGDSEDVSAMPKERLLALLDEDTRKYKLDGSSPDLGYMTDFVLLIEKVKKHPWDDCAKFLAEREEIKRKIESSLKENAESKLASPGSSAPRFSGARTTNERVMVRGDGRSRYPYSARVLSSESVWPPYVVSDAYLGFGPAVMGSGETRVFQVLPQNIFRGMRLVVDSRIASAFMLHDLRVGVMSQSMSANPIPMTAFTENAIGINLGLDTATPGILVTMIVENITNSALTFAATLFGTTLR